MSTSEAPGVGNNSSTMPWDPGSPGSMDWPSVANSVVKMVLIAAIVCVSLFGNVVVLLVFHRKPQLLHVANRFVLNLLLADLLQTVLVMPFAIVATLPGMWPVDSRLCQALVVLMHLFAFAGVNTIMVVSVDRYLAIIHPLSYPTHMTPHLGTNLIACTWLLSLLQSTPPLYGWGAIGFDLRHNVCTVVWSHSRSYSALVATFSFWLPVTVMLGCYWMVFRAARRQNALVHPVQSHPKSQPNRAPLPHATRHSSPQHPSQHAPPPLDSFSAGGYPIRSGHRRFHYHCKAAWVVFVIMASYVLSMGPYSILNTVSICSSVPPPPWLASLALVLFFLQCCLHPYIYGYMHRSVRKEFLALLCGPVCGRGHPGHTSAQDSCFTVTDGRSTLHHLPSLVARVCPLRTWEEGTTTEGTSSSPTAVDRKSGDSRRETVSLSSDR